MKIRTTDELCDRIDGELAWRRKELSAIRFAIQRATEERQDTMLRAGIALLYAHWEGFVKVAATMYVCFVASRRLRYEQLSPSFIALSAQQKFRALHESGGISFYSGFVDLMLNQMSERPQIKYDSAVSTRANLTSKVLKTIVQTIGVDYSPYQSREKLIDESLVRSRNKIAHGDYNEVSLERFLDLYTNILDMLESFRTQIENAAVLKAYLAQPA